MGDDKTNDKINNEPMTGGVPFMVERVQSSPRWPGSLVVQVAGAWYVLPVPEGYHQPADVSELVEQPGYVPDVMGEPMRAQGRRGHGSRRPLAVSGALWGPWRAVGRSSAPAAPAPRRWPSGARGRPKNGRFRAVLRPDFFASLVGVGSPRGRPS